MKASIRVYVRKVGFARVNVEFSVNPILSGNLYSLVSAELDGAAVDIAGIIELNPGLDEVLSIERLGDYALREQGVDITGNPRKRPKKKTNRTPGTILKTLDLFIPVAPISVQKGARKGKWGFYNDGKKVDYFERIRREVLHLVPKEPLCGPLVVSWGFYMERPKVHLHPRSPHGIFPHLNTPDITNLKKGAEDALAKAGLWADDKQIWMTGPSFKVYREMDFIARIEVRIEYDESINQDIGAKPGQVPFLRKPTQAGGPEGLHKHRWHVQTSA